MKKAEWILRSHREHLATFKLLQARLERLAEVTDAEKDDYIAAQALRHMRLDGTPKASPMDSQTERIALTYMDRLQAERAGEAQSRRNEMREIRFYLQVYDAMMASLTPEEAWLAQARFADGKSLGRMLLDMPDHIAIRSKTTLSKRCARVIDQLEHFLSGMDAGSRAASPAAAE